MTRYLCDTSVLVAAVSSWHENHDRTYAEIELRERGNEQLVIAAHSLAETYAVLTRLPAPYRLRAADAVALIERNWSDAPTVHLTGPETWGALQEAQRRFMVGGQTYDVLIAVAALKARASTIVTWNLRHYSNASRRARSRCRRAA